ncbi:Rieske (2Fe-2S) protein [Nonomuraea sp. NBC_01738]|uniref:Rieske (2Fe-2S) protein n=1 Tax=Nonomuraea sp. NBC_01738 TaxID=2976003 RepID=UPI002E11136D|nr:Rieske (2Fe-2S) protein [Nonomuraea sp. NBC_01738]
MGDDLQSRRTVIAGVGAGGLTLALAACGGDNSPAGNATTATSAGAEPAPGGGLGSKADIPVGGGKIFADEKVVVTQPKAGEFKAFSAICTHKGCTVGTVEGGTINCPCHGSKFKIADGSVAHGPATKPLPAKEITLDGDNIKLA